MRHTPNATGQKWKWKKKGKCDSPKNAGGVHEKKCDTPKIEENMPFSGSFFENAKVIQEKQMRQAKKRRWYMLF